MKSILCYLRALFSPSLTAKVERFEPVFEMAWTPISDKPDIIHVELNTYFVLKGENILFGEFFEVVHLFEHDGKAEFLTNFKPTHYLQLNNNEYNIEHDWKVNYSGATGIK